jgi:hypothetical protein
MPNHPVPLEIRDLVAAMVEGAFRSNMNFRKSYSPS